MPVQRPRTSSAILALIVAALVTVGCSVTSTPTVAPTVAASPTEMATPVPTETTIPPTPTVEASATPRPTDAPAIEAAKAALAQQYDIAASEISVVKSEAVQWPDSCLGVQLPGMACAFHVVDGYRVILETRGVQYEYHTNGDGSQVIAALAMTWHREGGIAGFCNDLVIDVTGEATAYTCKGSPPTQVSQQLLTAALLQRLDTWRKTLQPFETIMSNGAVPDTMTVTLSFAGYGSREATDDEEKEIAGFASEVYSDIGGLQGTGAAADDASLLVGAFLTDLMTDPRGLATRSYLDTALQVEVDAGTPVTELLGIDGLYRSYGIQSSTIEAVASRAFVEVGLNFVSPIPRAFELILEDDIWKISTMVVYGVPEQVLPADIKTADLAILDFVWDLQTDDLPSAELLLTPNGRTQLGDLAQYTAGVTSIMAPSLRLAAISSDYAVYETTLLVQSDTGLESWQDGLNQRWFLLQKTGEGWQIDQMSASEVQLP